MNHNDTQLLKKIHAPASKYDYDGITGTWLLIPARIHLLLLAITLPIIIWVLPNISFRGDFRFILADYKYYFAGAFTIFCVASALLSIVKAQQVKSRVRPTNHIGTQIIAKTGPGRPAQSSTKKEAPAPHLGHVRRKESQQVSGKVKQTEKTHSEKAQSEKKAAVLKKPSVVAATEQPKSTRVQAPKTMSEQPLKTSASVKTPPQKKVTTRKNSSTTNIKQAATKSNQSAPSQPAPKKRTRKKPEQMKLDL